MFSASLRAFDETARHGSIRKASEVLGVAPSSVSRHIAILERQIGTALLHRRARGVELTHAGTLVAEFARAVLMEYDTLRADLDDLRGTQRRLLRLALVESVAHYGPIKAAAKFMESYRTVSFNVRLMPAPQVIEAVREGAYDNGITFCAQPDTSITKLASLPEPIVLVVSADDDLASAAQVELREIATRPLALPDSDFGVRQILDRAGTAGGFHLNPVLTSNVFETLRDFVRLRAGVAILPMRAVAHREGAENLRIIPLAGEAFRDATIDVIVLRKRRLPRVVKSFVDCLIEEIAAAPGTDKIR
jgi:DNA-binding transcriptional LysR family regulator